MTVNIEEETSTKGKSSLMIKFLHAASLIRLNQLSSGAGLLHRKQSAKTDWLSWIRTWYLSTWTGNPKSKRRSRPFTAKAKVGR